MKTKTFQTIGQPIKTFNFYWIHFLYVMHKNRKYVPSPSVCKYFLKSIITEYCMCIFRTSPYVNNFFISLIVEILAIYFLFIANRCELRHKMETPKASLKWFRSGCWHHGSCSTLNRCLSNSRRCQYSV